MIDVECTIMGGFVVCISWGLDKGCHVEKTESSRVRAAQHRLADDDVYLKKKIAPFSVGKQCLVKR